MSILPKISVVTPSFNQGIFLEETILSVLNQNYPNLEYVVIDGGSSDNSAEIIRKYESQLHFSISEKDNGHGHALNKGFSHTTGEIMAWINSDDKYTPWSLNVVAKIFTQFPHVNWIVGFNSWWNPDGAMTHASRHPKNIYDYLLGKPGHIQQESVFWRRSLWERAGGYIDQDYKLMIDAELWTRFFLLDELYSVDCILSGYRIHSTNRAFCNAQLVQGELEKAVAVMSQKCSEDVQKIYSRLSLLNDMKNSSVLNYIARTGLAKKHIARGALKKARYKNIFYENGVWSERILEFKI